MATASRRDAVMLDFLERAGWSAGQVFFATLLAGGTAANVGGLPWKYALVLALGAGVSSIVLTVIQYLTRLTNLSFWPDLLVRLAKTFLGSLAASWSAASVFDITKFGWVAALNVAALATVSALAKGLLARGQTIISTEAGPVAGEVAAKVAAAIPTQRTSPSTLPISTYLQAVEKK